MFTTHLLLLMRWAEEHRERKEFSAFVPLHEQSVAFAPHRNEPIHGALPPFSLPNIGRSEQSLSEYRRYVPMIFYLLHVFLFCSLLLAVQADSFVPPCASQHSSPGTLVNSSEPS